MTADDTCPVCLLSSSDVPAHVRAAHSNAVSEFAGRCLHGLPLSEHCPQCPTSAEDD